MAGKVEDTWLYIAEIHMHPEWQSHGIGRLLLQRIIHTG
ncbi:GNAT family N-acetyltransferase [Type-D symbiont of Plautia stali]